MSSPAPNIPAPSAPGSDSADVLRWVVVVLCVLGALLGLASTMSFIGQNAPSVAGMAITVALGMPLLLVLCAGAMAYRSGGLALGLAVALFLGALNSGLVPMLLLAGSGAASPFAFAPAFIFALLVGAIILLIRLGALRRP